MILISKHGKTKDITIKELNIIKDEVCFCLKSGPVFLFQIFIIGPPPPPKGYKIVSLIID
jgi:hypothetical protein